MTEVISDQSVEANDGSKNVLDLGLVVGELTLEDDAASDDDVSLEGLEQELQDYKSDDVVTMILSKGTASRNYTKDVEHNLRRIELDSIQDYIKESDNLISLHDQIHDCNTILLQMEKLLSGFQAEIGSISSDIKVLQERSLDMGLKLKNRKAAESKLAKFVEDIIVPPRMIEIIVDGEVNEEYLKTLQILSRKLQFVECDAMAQTSKVITDVQPEVEKLHQKAVSKKFPINIGALCMLGLWKQVLCGSCSSWWYLRIDTLTWSVELLSEVFFLFSPWILYCKHFPYVSNIFSFHPTPFFEGCLSPAVLQYQHVKFRLSPLPPR